MRADGKEIQGKTKTRKTSAMKKDIILAGVGGQGILSIAAAIGLAAREADLYVRQSEVHGMSQRGGEVQAHLRISSEPIAADLITEGTADLIVSMEPMEAIRYVNYLSESGWLITNSEPFVNIDDYPDRSRIMEYIESFPNHSLLDAEAIARKCGSAKSSNMVLLGACVPHLGISATLLKLAIHRLFSTKGERVMDVNLKAFDEGQNLSKESISHAG
jgi:indolepyruvate ferredoxin oxidoreductase beta subunit